jgi:hypothetical protein
VIVVVPEPVPLEMPRGDPAALEDFVEDVAGTAYRLAVLRTCLTGRAASAPGWRGADASAAAAQVGVVAALAEELSEGVHAAAHRLRAHHECLRRTRRRVAVLRDEQDEDFALARAGLADLPDPAMALRSDAAVAVAVVEQLEAAEDARRREHARLLEELADDAAATARTLAESCSVVGGRGARGDGARVLVHLAVELPGWGNRELAALGTELAAALVGGPVTPEELNALARGAAGYGGAPAFAKALLTGLGREGVRHLLTVLGFNALGSVPPVAHLLASAFGAAAPDGGRDPVQAVLGATYLHADDRDGTSDEIATGMAVVLGAGASTPTGGLRPVTVAAWARQMLLREHAKGAITGIGSLPQGWTAELSDPTALAIRILADRGEPGVAAALLADRHVWQALLSRFWGDGGAALGDAVELAGRDPGAAGSQAVRTGLEVIGAGVFEGDPSDWTVSRKTVAGVSTALGRAVAAHVGVAVEALWLGVDGRVDGREDAVRGLGYVTIDRNGAAAIERALYGWYRAQPSGLEGTSPMSPLPTVAVSSAYLAVQEYGQRLAHALHGFEQQDDAQNREWFWDRTFALLGQLPSWWGVAGGVVEGYVAIALGMDGTWENVADRGLHVDRDTAAESMVADLPPDRAGDADAVARQARAAFDRTARLLGSPRAPVSPLEDYAEPFLDGAVGVTLERLKKVPLGAG